MGTIASQITSLTIVYKTRLFRRRSKKTSKLRVTGLCMGNSPGTGEFPAQMASNAENISIWWRHHGMKQFHFIGRVARLVVGLLRNDTNFIEQSCDDGDCSISTWFRSYVDPIQVIFSYVVDPIFDDWLIFLRHPHWLFVILCWHDFGLISTVQFVLLYISLLPYSKASINRWSRW